MSEKIALLDLDGTVADYDLALRLEMEALRYPGEPEETISPRLNSPWVEARRHLISKVPGFWKNLPRIEKGFQIYQTLVDTGFAVHVLTKGPSTKPIAWMEKLEWCREHLPDAQVTITENKSISYGRILVDDFPPYFTGWLKNRPRGLVIVPSQAWNEGCEDLHPNVWRYDGSDPEKLSEVVRAAFDREDGQFVDISKFRV